MLPTDVRSKLESYLTSNNLPLNAFDTMRPWLVASMIAVREYNVRGYAADFGGEKLFTDQAMKNAIPILGFETAAQQVAALTAGSPNEEILFLSYSLDDMDRVDTIISDLTNAWADGDDKKLDQLLHAELSRIPGAEKALIHDRNEDWVVQLNQIMNEPGYFFVAVGAGHLVGGRGVPELMEKAGHQVTRN